jgi:hypothetical protein
MNGTICRLCLYRPTVCCAVNSYKCKSAGQNCCGVGFMAPDLLSAPDKVTLPGLSLAFPFRDPLLWPIKAVLVDAFQYCSSERAAFGDPSRSIRCVAFPRYQTRLRLRYVIPTRAITLSRTTETHLTGPSTSGNFCIHFCPTRTSPEIAKQESRHHASHTRPMC